MSCSTEIFHVTCLMEKVGLNVKQRPKVVLWEREKERERGGKRKKKKNTLLTASLPNLFYYKCL